MPLFLLVGVPLFRKVHQIVYRILPTTRDRSFKVEREVETKHTQRSTTECIESVGRKIMIVDRTRSEHPTYQTRVVQQSCKGRDRSNIIETTNTHSLAHHYRLLSVLSGPLYALSLEFYQAPFSSLSSINPFSTIFLMDKQPSQSYLNQGMKSLLNWT